jgi:TPP-dependent indolepyruvate ferredoxin oxidoreductase alpha subunit
MADLNDRVTLIEQALTRLTIIQEQQTAQTERIIKSMDNFTRIAVTVEQNAKDIDTLHDAIQTMYKSIDETKKTATSVKEYCSTLSFNRLRTAISVSVGIIMAVFGYIYNDLHSVTKRCDIIEKDIIKLELKHGVGYGQQIKR